MHFIRLLHALLIPLAVSQAEWTKYSDRADLPMSKKARDRIKEKLKEVDPSKLSSEHRETYNKLSEILNEDHSNQDSVGFELLIIPALFVIAGLALCYASSRSNQLPKEVNMDEAREARLKKFN